MHLKANTALRQNRCATLMHEAPNTNFQLIFVYMLVGLFTLSYAHDWEVVCEFYVASSSFPFSWILNCRISRKEFHFWRYCESSRTLNDSSLHNTVSMFHYCIHQTALDMFYSKQNFVKIFFATTLADVWKLEQCVLNAPMNIPEDIFWQDWPTLHLMKWNMWSCIQLLLLMIALQKEI